VVVLREGINVQTPNRSGSRKIPQPIPSILSGFATAVILCSLANFFIPEKKSVAEQPLKPAQAPQVLRKVETAAVTPPISEQPAEPKVVAETPSVVENAKPMEASVPAPVRSRRIQPVAQTKSALQTPPVSAAEKPKKIAQTVTKAGSRGAEMQMKAPEPAPEQTNSGPDMMMAPYQTDEQ
jgi:hypothetical protein